MNNVSMYWWYVISVRKAVNHLTYRVSVFMCAPFWPRLGVRVTNDVSSIGMMLTQSLIIPCSHINPLFMANNPHSNIQESWQYLRLANFKRMSLAEREKANKFEALDTFKIYLYQQSFRCGKCSQSVDSVKKCFWLCSVLVPQIWFHSFDFV